jgi:hypothetical protein
MTRLIKRLNSQGRILDLNWLDELNAVNEELCVGHVRLSTPVRRRIDGRSGRGIIMRPSEPSTEAKT